MKIRRSYRRNVVGKAISGRKGPLGPAKWALGLRLSSTKERKRHNVTVITVGSRYYSLCSVSSSLSHANYEQPFRTLAIKWEVIFFRLPASFIPVSVFVTASWLLSRCDVVDDYITHQHDLPQHQSQPDRRHPPSIRWAPAGACGKGMLPVPDPYRGGDWGWRRLHWIDVSSTTEISYLNWFFFNKSF